MGVIFIIKMMKDRCDKKDVKESLHPCPTGIKKQNKFPVGLKRYISSLFSNSTERDKKEKD